MRFYKFARLVASLAGSTRTDLCRTGSSGDGDGRGRAISMFDDPRWYSPEGVGAALEQGLVELRSLSGIGPTREERVARVLEEEGWEEDDPPDDDPPDDDPPDDGSPATTRPSDGSLARTHGAASD